MTMFNHFESDFSLNQRLLQVVSDGMSETLEVGNAIALYGNGDEELTKSVQDTMLAFISMQNDIEQQITALRHVKQMGSREGNPTSLTGLFQEKLAELQTANPNDPATLRRHAKFKELQVPLQSTGSIEEQLAALRQTLTGGGASGDDSQTGDLAFTEMEVNTRCPYTGTTMRDPVRNKRCGHVYDREGITTYIKQKKSKAKCPVGGCGNTNPVQISDLEPHTEMKRYITLMSQSQGL